MVLSSSRTDYPTFVVSVGRGPTVGTELTVGATAAMRTAIAVAFACSVPVCAGFGWFNSLYNGNFWDTPIVHSDVWDLELKWMSIGFDFDMLLMACTPGGIPGSISTGAPAPVSASELESILHAGGAYVSDIPGANVTVAAKHPLKCVSGEPPLLGAVTSIVSTNISSAFDVDEGQ